MPQIGAAQPAGEGVLPAAWWTGRGWGVVIHCAGDDGWVISRWNALSLWEREEGALWWRFSHRFGGAGGIDGGYYVKLLM